MKLDRNIIDLIKQGKTVEDLVVIAEIVAASTKRKDELQSTLKELMQEMKGRKQVDQVYFECPHCGDKRLECVEINATVISIVDCIEDNGDFDWGVPTIDDSDVDRFQCVGCGFVLEDAGEKINDNQKVVGWVAENCGKRV